MVHRDVKCAKAKHHHLTVPRVCGPIFFLRGDSPVIRPALTNLARCAGRVKAIPGRPDFESGGDDGAILGAGGVWRVCLANPPKRCVSSSR